MQTSPQILESINSPSLPPTHNYPRAYIPGRVKVQEDHSLYEALARPCYENMDDVIW